MAELGQALQVTWTEVHELNSDGWDIRVVFSEQGPPFIELVEGPPGSPWYVESGSAIDHLGYWSDAYASDRARLETLGLEVVRGGAGRVHFQLPAAGFRIELFDSAGRDALHEHFGLRAQRLGQKP